MPTDAQRNWNVAKAYIKSGPNIKNILNAMKLQEKIGQLEFLLHLRTNPITYRRLSNELFKAKLEYNLLKLESTGLIYTPQEETILKKYDLFPKMFGKVFKDQKPSIVQDSKGNSWFEFNIPKDMLNRELLYKSGGKSPKLIRRKEAKK